MGGTERVVYLEDVQTTKQVVRKEDSSGSVSSAATQTSLKRQRTLFDMVGSSQEPQSSSKKKKISPSGSSMSIKSASSFSRMQSLDSITFSMAEFKESLEEGHMDLLKLECEVMGESWLKLLKDEIKKPYFIALKRFLWAEGVRGAEDSLKSLKVYPAPRNIYSWSNTPLGRVKVVIIGQDPYHGPDQAHGLCFSVPMGVPPPPSLKNIYAEIKAEYNDFEAPKHGNLTAWADNGVLMLNTCLTVRAGQAGSHSNKGWEQFTDKVVDVVDKYGGANLGKNGLGRGVVFLAWGGWAAKRVAKLSTTKHLILHSAHPSPLSAHRGFLGNGHFKTANKWLEEKYGSDGKGPVARPVMYGEMLLYRRSISKTGKDWERDFRFFLTPARQLQGPIETKGVL